MKKFTEAELELIKISATDDILDASVEKDAPGYDEIPED